MVDARCLYKKRWMGKKHAHHPIWGSGTTFLNAPPWQLTGRGARTSCVGRRSETKPRILEACLGPWLQAGEGDRHPASKPLLHNKGVDSWEFNRFEGQSFTTSRAGILQRQEINLSEKPIRTNSSLLPLTLDLMTWAEIPRLSSSTKIILVFDKNEFIAIQ